MHHIKKDTAMHVSMLYRYPLKSAGAEALEATWVAARGFTSDRRWLIVDENGRFITQREQPRLVYVSVERAQDDASIRLSVDGMPDCLISPPGEDGAQRPVVIWDDRVEAVDAGDAAAAWLSAYLETPCRLVYMHDAVRREVDMKYGRPGDVVSFADGYPVLLTTEASLADLNGRLESPIPMRRFRPNIVIDGADAYAEDGWREIRIGEVTFRVVKPCARCVMITLDPDAGVFQKEPLRTLAGYRRDGNKVFFGQNLIPSNEGMIRVGEPVEVLH
ncbi:MAG: MOSC domain-containing protein [Rhizobiaceae bacterium]|nr:MOSC domain-containing protein [Rhizobiaceae bacterium]